MSVRFIWTDYSRVKVMENFPEPTGKRLVEYALGKKHKIKEYWDALH